MLRTASDLFLGSHTSRIDQKGRIAAPADFRRALDLKDFNGFFCHPSLTGPFLVCGGSRYVLRLHAMIDDLPPFDPKRRALERTLLGRARTVSFDADGRFILPAPLRAHASLEDAVFFVGVGETFEIWRSDGAEDDLAREEDLAREALTLLHNPRPSVSGGAS